MRVDEHGAGGAENEAREHVWPVPLGAVSEREEDGRDDAERLAEEEDPLRVNFAGERASEAHGERDYANGKPRTTLVSKTIPCLRGWEVDAHVYRS